MLPVFFINRDSDVSRRLSIEGALTQPGLQAHRVSAAGPNDLLSQPPATISAPEMACYYGHRLAWTEVLRAGMPFAVVVEDDAIVPGCLSESISEITGCLPGEWDVVHLYGHSSRAVRPLATLKAGNKIVRYSRIPPGAVAYLISAAGCRKLLAQTEPRWPVDTDLRRPWKFGLDSYGVAPAIVRHNDDFASSLSGQRARGRRGLSLNNPLHTPMAPLWNIRKLGPHWWAKCLALNVMRKVTRRTQGPQTAADAEQDERGACA